MFNQENAVTGGQAREIARLCREALNQEIYGGEAPNDSNTLTEVWPTRTGGAFTVTYRGEKFAVAIGPCDSELSSYPDYCHE